jgi:glyoxylase-like metal-dependent hydrolase (beta-lactamase superfamily II)
MMKVPKNKKERLRMMEESLQRLSENIAYLPRDDSTDRPILAAVSGTRNTLIIDAGASPAHVALFQSELDRHQIPRGDYVVITHWHWDHTFGMSALDVPTIAHVNTRNHLEKMLSYEWTDAAIDSRVQQGIEDPFCAEMIKKEFSNRGEIVITLPDILFEQRLIIDLGGLHCVVEHVGGDHSDDNTVVFVEEERTLFLGDCLGPAIYADKWFYRIEQINALLDKIEGYNAETYLESHWVPESKEDYLKEVNRLRVIADCIEKYDGNRDTLIAEVGGKLERQVTEDDLETITYFFNGLP